MRGVNKRVYGIVLCGSLGGDIWGRGGVSWEVCMRAFNEWVRELSGCFRIMVY